MIEYNTAFQSVPFDKIKSEHFIPAFESLIGECRNGLRKIAGSVERPDFQNTIEALERLNYKLKRLEQIFFNLNSADSTGDFSASYCIL
jgi:peptidyl-dipeptidase Dcp